MATSFPGTAIDSFTNPTSTNSLNSPDHAAQHANVNDAVTAIETKLGINSSAVTTTIDYKLSGVPATDKAASLTGSESLTNKTLTTPTIASFTNATHNHANAAGGGQLGATALDTGSSWAWTAFTPTVTASVGSLTTASATGRYVQIGKTVHFHAELTVTTNGTGATSILYTLPVTAQASSNVSLGAGRATTVSGKALQQRLNSATQAAVFNYDNTYPAASGELLLVNGTYEAA